jgi:dihydrofolate reductase
VRTFKLQVQVTADGYMGGPNGEMDWMTVPWSDDLNRYVDALHDPVDCIVMGRKLAEGFIPYWAAGPEDEDQASIDMMNRTPKVVLSKTLDRSPWENAEVASDLTGTIARMKSQAGGDIIAYGGSSLVRALIAERVLDEIHLFVNPTSIGAGLPVFPEDTRQQLQLVSARSFECGVAALHFEPARS